MQYDQNTTKISAQRLRLLPFLLATMMVIMLAAAPMLWAQADHDDCELDEAHIFFELNNTDGDLGIHALIDGEAWEELYIYDPDNHDGSNPTGDPMLSVWAEGRLGLQGLTELFFESAEPPFESDDPEEEPLDPAEFFARFPEGEYLITGTNELGCPVEISHVMPAPPMLYVNGQPAAKDCDADLPVVYRYMPVFISWEPVDTYHPELGESGPVTIHNYEVVVEIDETPWKTSTILSPNETSFLVPKEILALAEFDGEGEAEVKFEVLVRDENWNQTAVESCFTVKKWRRHY
jgi:hypothetical protein